MWPILCKALMFLPVISLSAPIGHAAWFVRYNPEPDSDKLSCHLESEKVAISDGYQQITASIRVAADHVAVGADSPLDPSFSDIAIETEGSKLIEMDEMDDRKSARFVRHYSYLVAEFKRGLRARVQLRFWPTWPATGTHDATFSLVGFTKAYDQMLACRPGTP